MKERKKVGSFHLFSSLVVSPILSPTKKRETETSKEAEEGKKKARELVVCQHHLGLLLRVQRLWDNFVLLSIFCSFCSTLEHGWREQQ